MDKIVVNIEFKGLLKKGWTDTKKRTEHLADRMISRGIGVNNIKDAVRQGAKKIRKDGSIVAEFRWYKVVYRQFNIKDIKKIYPITVIEV